MSTQTKLVILTLCSLIAVWSVTAVEFADCGSKGGTVNSITVDGCSASDAACPITANKNITVHVNFTSDIATADATLVLYGKVTIVVPFNVPFDTDPNACGSWGVKCPIKANDVNQLTVAGTVPAEIALGKSPIIHVEVKADDFNSIFCKEFPATLTT